MGPRRRRIFRRHPRRIARPRGRRRIDSGRLSSNRFFSRRNVELAVKALDGRAVNGHYSIFYGALSDVEYTITVTDTSNGSVKTYSSPQGQMASRADTTAFR